MDISYDYRDLFSVLNRYKAQYLVVGAYAVAYYTEPRFTKDLDIWVNPDRKNAPRVYRALMNFGAPLKGVEIKDFASLSHAIEYALMILREREKHKTIICLC